MADLLQLAWKHHGLGEFSKSAELCDKILVENPLNVGALCCRALSNWAQAKNISGAVQDLTRAKDLAPESGPVRHNLATVLASVGRLKDAVAQFEYALKINPLDGMAFYAMSQNQRYRTSDAHAARFEKAIKDNSLHPNQREFAHFGLTKIYDDIGDPSRAMAHAKSANILGARAYDFAGEEARLTNLRKLVNSNSMRFAAADESDGFVPIFIVGMPRTGTTLIESILARHGMVFAGGEHSMLPALEQKFARQLGLNKGAGQLDKMLGKLTSRDFALAARDIEADFVRRAGPGKTHFIDKLPHNAERIGLIYKLFPKARVIYARRNPLDTGLSNFFMRFYAGNGYSTDLLAIGRHFRNVTESMEHWPNIVDLDILRVNYESLVANAPTEIERILDYCALPFDAKCLQPEKGDRGVITASQWQVRQPIYQRAVEKWRRYEDHLGPMIEGMGGRAFLDKYEMY